MRLNTNFRAARLGLLVAWLVSSAAGLAAQNQIGEFQPVYEAALAAFGGLLDFSQPVALTPPPAAGTAEPAASLSLPYGLEELLGLAVANSPAILAVRSQVQAAMADLRAAEGRRWPSFNVETSGSLLGNPMGPISIRAGQLGVIGGVALPTQDMLIYGGMENTYYKFGITGSLPVYTWGKIGLGIEVARRGVAIAELQYQKAIHEVRLQVRGNLDALAYIMEAIAVTELNRRVGARLNEIAERSAAVGFLTTTDVFTIRIQLKEIDIALARLEEQRDRRLADLARLTGLPTLSAADLRLETQPAGRARWDEARAGQLMLAGSFDLLSLRLLVEVRDGLQQLAARQALGLPDIGLQVELSYAGPRFPFLEIDWFRQDDYQLTISLGTSGGVFSNPVRAGEAARAAAEYEETVQRSREAERSVRSFLRETFLATDLQRIRLEFLQLQQQAWLAELRLKQLAIRAGAGDETAYLRQLMDCLGKLAEGYGSLAEYRGSLLTLEGAVGLAAE
jgi:outer membrane protein TolC